MNTPTLSYRQVIEEMLGEKAFAFIAKGRELAKKGYKVYSFGIGQPDLPTPDHIIEAGIKALREKFTGYTETAGIPELRSAIAEYLNTRYGSDVKPDEVIVTPGTKGAIFLAIMTYLRPGDEIIIPEPSYPAYSEISKVLGINRVFVPLKWLGEDKGFALPIEEIEEAITPKTRMIVVNNPHNPTGGLFEPRQLDELMDIARRHKLMILVDEIYDNFVYDNAEFKSMISYSDWRDYIVYTNGFSKTFSMTGWRLGYLVVRREVAQHLPKLAVNIWGCPVSFGQKAAIIALKGDWTPIKKMIELFRMRRDLLVEKLRKIPGFEVWKSKGAFYLFPRIKKILDETGLDVEEFVNKIIDKYHIILLPGTAFPDKAGREFLRLSFCTDFETIEEGTQVLKKAIEEILSTSKR